VDTIQDAVYFTCPPPSRRKRSVCLRLDWFVNDSLMEWLRAYPVTDFKMVVDTYSGDDGKIIAI
jgi:hypothetical protein